MKNDTGRDKARAARRLGQGGLADFARALERYGVEIVSTGGTAAALEAAGVKVRAVENFTGLPEMLDGRVKTLHPKIHGGILARRADENHQRQMQQHRIEPIDLVVVNFYPFEHTVSSAHVRLEDAIENIDIGGPTLVRAAAKNHDDVAVVVDPADYATIAAELDANGARSPPKRDGASRARRSRAWRPTTARSRIISARMQETVTRQPSARASASRSNASRRCATARIRIRPARSTVASSKSPISFTARNFRSTTSSISARR